MLMSRGAFTRTVEPLSSSDDAAYLSNTLNLVDCSPSTSVALQWTSGVQNTSEYVHLPWRMSPAPTTECRVFALLGLQGVPAGTRLELWGGASLGSMLMLTAATVVELPNGTFGAWLARDSGDGWSHEFFAWRIYNDDGVTTPIGASAIINVGELYATPAWEWPIGRWEWRVVLPQVINRANSGAAKKVKRDAYQTVEVMITPHDWQTTMLGANSLRAMIYDLGRQDCVAIVPRPNLRGAAGVDNDIVPATAMLADLVEVGSFGADAAIDHYPLTLQFEEFL
jgi:hypothetical protein